MPSPFPGMDPYLEDPILWSGVHQGLISAARTELNRLLPPGYVADAGERVYVVASQRDIDYRAEPTVPLKGADAEWARAVLSARQAAT